VTVYLKLTGPNDKGLAPKGCTLQGWNDPSYKGIGLVWPEDVWIGMRLDEWIVIDCDDEQAKDDWLVYLDKPISHTWVRKTPHGYHFIYKRGIDSYALTARKLTAISPKLEMKTGVGHQIVFSAPGYSDLGDAIGGWTALTFDPSWLPAVEARDKDIAEWSEMPDGIGDSAMISFAGKFREWGMDEQTIRKVLRSINEITMTREPMPEKSIRRLARQAGKWDPDEPQTIECIACGVSMEIR
jgi:hypothetical protein